MTQKVEIYLKEIKVIENGHHTEDKDAANILVATWKQPNFFQEEIASGGKMKLKDYDPNDTGSIFKAKKILKWRLFKATVESNSEIEILVTGTVKVSKFAKWFMKRLAGALGSTVGAIPLVGSEITDMMKEIDDKTTKIAKGVLAVPDKGLSAGDHVIKLKAPEKLKIRIDTGYKPTGTYISKKKWVDKVGKGKSNGELVVTVKVYP